MKPVRVLVASALCALPALPAHGQHVESRAIHERVQQATDQLFDELVAIRRDFHVHPEVSGQEQRTSARIAEHLEALGLEVHTNLGGHGVVGVLDGGKQGRRIAWRADIDAMPSTLPDVVEFQSVNEGVRHICGHDVHAAIGLGIAKVLSRQASDLEGTVYFIFQPSEENYRGARAMIDDGLLERIRPEEIYALHVAPLPVGAIATRPGNIYASTSKVEVVYRTSEDDEAKVAFTRQVISGFQDVAPGSKFWNPANMGDPEVGIDQPATVFKDFLTVDEDFDVAHRGDQLAITATLDASSNERLDAFVRELRARLGASAHSDELVSVGYAYEKVVVDNSRLLTDATTKSIADLYGEDSVVALHGVVTADRGDDFAYFQQKVPGVYYFLGASDFEAGVVSMPHSPGFAVDEESIRFGVKYFSSMLIERLDAQRDAAGASAPGPANRGG